MSRKLPSPESRIASFLALFVEAHQKHFEELRYLYDDNGAFPEGINRLNPDPAGERYNWEPNNQLYWQWRSALETFAHKLREEKNPLDIYRALTALERRAGMGMYAADHWIRTQEDFPKYYRDWCTAR